MCSSFSSEKTSALFFRLLLSSVIKKAALASQKKAKKKAKELFSFFHQLFHFNLLSRLVVLPKFSLSRSAAVVNTLFCSFSTRATNSCVRSFLQQKEKSFFFPQFSHFQARSGYCVCIKRARSFAESFARKRERERKDDDDDDDDELLFDNDDDDDDENNDERFVDDEE